MKKSSQRQFFLVPEKKLCNFAHPIPQIGQNSNTKFYWPNAQNGHEHFFCFGSHSFFGCGIVEKPTPFRRDCAVNNLHCIFWIEMPEGKDMIHLTSGVNHWNCKAKNLKCDLHPELDFATEKKYKQQTAQKMSDLIAIDQCICSLKYWLRQRHSCSDET